VATIGKAILAPFKAAGTKAVETVRPAIQKRPNAAEMAGDGSLASIRQPDNPGQTSAQNFEHTREEEIVFAAPTTITETTGETVKTIEVPAGSKKIVRETQKVGQSLGAAQKDTTRETSAFLYSFRWVQVLGVLVMLVGVVGFAHPAARLLIGGKDTAMVVGLVGMGMIIGPFFLVKYANWLVGLLLVAALYWFWSRAKFREGLLDAKITTHTTNQQ
jgi:hypothetical protein